jgi:hypothetical protein
MLIPVDDAKKILHIARDSDWQWLVQHQSGQTAVIQTTPDGTFVMKTSLQQYLQPTASQPAGH